MSGFLYYRPDFTGTVTLANVREWNLGYAFTASPNGTVCMNNTPDGRTGSVFADSARLGEWQAIMNLEEQTWRKSADNDWYVGYWKASPPTPENVERPAMLAGYPITIGGMIWQIPKTACFDEESESLMPALPCKLEYSGNGQWTKGEVLEIHKQLWEVGRPFREDFLARYIRGEQPRDFTDNEIGMAVCTHLAANYVVGPDELTAMSAISTSDPGIGLAVMVANDLPTIMNWSEQQKKTADHATKPGSDIAAGEAA